MVFCIVALIPTHRKRSYPVFGFSKKYELTKEKWEFSAYTPAEMEIRQKEARTMGKATPWSGLVVSNEKVANPKGVGYRIRALRDIPKHNIKAGDLGGLVSNKNILSQRGDCWIANEAVVIVFGDFGSSIIISDDALVCDSAFVRQLSVVRSEGCSQWPVLLDLL